jgi:hypothetical protein
MEAPMPAHTPPALTFVQQLWLTLAGGTIVAILTSISTALLTMWKTNRDAKEARTIREQERTERERIRQADIDERERIRQEDVAERDRIRQADREESRNSWLRDQRSSAFATLLEHMNLITNLDPRNYEIKECTIAAARAALFISVREDRERVLSYPNRMRIVKERTIDNDLKPGEQIYMREYQDLVLLSVELGEYLCSLAVAPIIVTFGATKAIGVSNASADAVVI